MLSGVGAASGDAEEEKPTPSDEGPAIGSASYVAIGGAAASAVFLAGLFCERRMQRRGKAPRGTMVVENTQLGRSPHSKVATFDEVLRSLPHNSRSRGSSSSNSRGGGQGILTISIDTTGDGIVDSVAIDTTGNGKVDTVFPLYEKSEGGTAGAQGSRSIIGGKNGTSTCLAAKRDADYKNTVQTNEGGWRPSAPLEGPEEEPAVLEDLALQPS